MDIFLVKKFDNSFKIAYESDYELAKKIKPNEIRKFTVTKPRNLKFHNKFMALIDMVYNNQEIYAHKEELRKDLIIEAGFFTEHVDFHGEVKKTAKSMSFASMDEYEFNDLYNGVLDQIVIHFKFKKDSIIEYIDKYFESSKNYKRE